MGALKGDRNDKMPKIVRICISNLGYFEDFITFCTKPVEFFRTTIRVECVYLIPKVAGSTLKVPTLCTAIFLRLRQKKW